MTKEEMELVIEKMEANQISAEELETIRNEIDELGTLPEHTELQTIFMTGWVLCESRLIQDELIERGRITKDDSPVWRHLTNLAEKFDPDN
mgnify:CR=1 FL=1